jgi:predicted CopG family antitoxin
MQVRRDTWERLRALGSMGDSFDDVIRRLLDHYDEGRRLGAALNEGSPS